MSSAEQYIFLQIDFYCSCEHVFYQGNGCKDIVFFLTATLKEANDVDLVSFAKKGQSRRIPGSL